MFELRRVLCPIEFTDTTPCALRHAIVLAADHGAEAHVLHVLDAPYPQGEVIVPGFDFESYYAEMEERAQRQLAELVRGEVPRARAIEIHVTRGKPSTTIVEFADKHNMDMIVMPTCRRGNGGRPLIGATTNRVIRLASCPVATVPSDATGTGGGFRTILHPTDFSEFADQALPLAVGLARRYEAKLILLHVLAEWNADPANPEWRFPELPTEQREAMEVSANRSLEKRENQMPPPVEVSRMIVRGFNPPSDIVNVAVQAGVDLIVMATHGRTGVAHFLLGSTAEKVVRHARCPVLTVRPPQIRHRDILR
jgi:nucleotide-binding universal stress UspA family protein